MGSGIRGTGTLVQGRELQARIKLSKWAVISRVSRCTKLPKPLCRKSTTKLSDPPLPMTALLRPWEGVPDVR